MSGSADDRPKQPRRISRRALLYGGCAAVGAGAAGKLLWDRNEAFMRAATVVARVETYRVEQLVATIRDGLRELGVGRPQIAGKVVLLKPNLVEPRSDAPQINTHPAVVRAAAEVLRRLDAREVLVGEAPGHHRDTRLVLEAAELGPVLREDRIPFVDLNHDDVYRVHNLLGFTGLDQLHLPKTLRRCDLVLSLAKMKTHHWAGVTLSMKNLFGVMPGLVYGWPKNVLHAVGISQSILDITAAVRPYLALVDGIVGMEGDGPIMGRPKRAGLLVLGRNPVAVDATAARLMGIPAERIEYLAAASGRLGPIRAGHIEQRGEPPERLVQPFVVLDHPTLRHLVEGA
jgi:uncharacterized protein (DUF362 family)